MQISTSKFNIKKQILMLNCLVLIEKWPFKKGEHLLAENELKKLKTFNSTYFISKSHFEEDVIV